MAPGTLGSASLGTLVLGSSGTGGGVPSSSPPPVSNPVYRLELALSGQLQGYFRIGISTIGGNDRIGGEFADSGFTSVAERLMGFRTQRGREDELSGVSAGTLSADLDDYDGALDPENTLSPYYPNIQLMRRARIVAAYGEFEYTLGYGFVTDYQAQPVAVTATVAIQATDLFTRMGRKRPPVAYPEQRVDQRIGAMLDQVGWPTGRMRRLDASSLTVPTATVGTDTTMLAHIDTMLKADRGLFFIAGDGGAVYHSRQRRFGAVSRGTFGASGLPIKSIRPVYNDAGIYNDVRGKRTAGVEQVAADATSGATYDWRTYTIPTDAADLLGTDARVLSLATYLLAQRKDPVQRVAEITLDPMADPDALWPHVLEAEIGDRITLDHSVPGTTGLGGIPGGDPSMGTDYFIERIAHTWTPRDGHEVTWGLSRVPANNDQYLVIGDAQRGLVGVGRIAF